MRTRRMTDGGSCQPVFLFSRVLFFLVPAFFFRPFPASPTAEAQRGVSAVFPGAKKGIIALIRSMVVFCSANRFSVVNSSGNKGV